MACFRTLLLAVAIATCASMATAARLTESPGPPVGTTIDGFNEVMGPSATEPEHAGEFVKPRFEPCPSCPQPAPAGSRPGEPNRH